MNTDQANGDSSTWLVADDYQEPGFSLSLWANLTLDGKHASPRGRIRERKTAANSKQMMLPLSVLLV